MEDCRLGDCRCPISHILSTIFCPDQVGALADGVREIRDYPPSRLAPFVGHRFEGQAPRLTGAGPIFEFATERGQLAGS